jgi:hypothetical protein
MQNCFHIYNLPVGNIRWSRKKGRPPKAVIANMRVPAFALATSLRLRLKAPFTEFPSPEKVALFPGVRNVIQGFLSAEKGEAQKHWPKLIKRAYPELRDDTLEDMLIKLVVRCYTIRSRFAASPARLHDSIEFCAGQGNITLESSLAGFKVFFLVFLQFRQERICSHPLRQIASIALQSCSLQLVCFYLASGRGLNKFLYAAAFDIAYHNDHNMCTAVGLRCWLDAVAECRQSAALWFGTQCSSFGGMCRSGHMRSPKNGYWGHREKAFVRVGNLMMVV